MYRFHTGQIIKYDLISFTALSDQRTENLIWLFYLFKRLSILVYSD